MWAEKKWGYAKTTPQAGFKNFDSYFHKSLLERQTWAVLQYMHITCSKVKTQNTYLFA